jgi:hypothetical protein
VHDRPGAIDDGCDSADAVRGPPLSRHP